MAFDFKNPYAPPGVYTETEYESALGGVLGSTNIPMLIGPGNEILTRNGLEVVRGSSQSVDQRIPLDDMAGRAVIDDDGNLGDFNGEATVVMVRNFPIVDGQGNGRTTNDPADVTAFINGEPSVVLAVNGANGTIELAVAATLEDEVMVTYFFNRTDTQQTDDLSAQVSGDGAEITGTGAEGAGFEIEAGTNDTLELTVDGESASFELPEGTWTAVQVIGFINAEEIGSLEASTITNNEGDTVILLSAEQGIAIGAGLANDTLGIVNGDETSRNARFFTHQRPIVDGTNAGRTLDTGSTTGVVVTVDGAEVEVSEVDGKNGGITLAVAPAAGSTLEVTYFWNSWQDTFDYVFDIGVTRMLRCGLEPSRMDYLAGSDFILQDDKLHWGTAAIIAADSSSELATPFDDTQITAQLADCRTHMELCEPVTDGGATSRTAFTLSRIPTSGNGVGSPGNEFPLTPATFKAMTNDRRDVWSNRPELVTAFAGYDVQDALDRGAVTVASVDANTKTVTLAEAIEPGMSLFATHWYNGVDDETFTLTCVSAGASSVGTYSITDSGGDSVFAAPLTDKGDGLVEVLQFESGNSNLPQARFEAVDSDLFTGPVGEIVTVTLVDKDETPAMMSFGNPGPYFFVDGSSDSMIITVDGGATRTMLGASRPAAAMLVSAKAQYDEAAPDNNTSWTIDAGSNDTLSLSVDGQTISATVGAANAGIADFVTALNAAADAVPPQYTASTMVRNRVEIAAGVFDNIRLHWNDDAEGAETISVDIAAGVYTNVGDLAAAVQAAIEGGITTVVLAGTTDVDDYPTVTVAANVSSQLVFTCARAVNATHGRFSFLSSVAAKADFAANVAGIDTAALADTDQTQILHGPIAKLGDGGNGDSGADSHDRLILRNRIIPGNAGSVNPRGHTGLGLEVLSGTAMSLFGWEGGESAEPRSSATVLPAAVKADVGFGTGQTAVGGGVDTDGQAELTFFDGGVAANPANDTLDLTIDGTSVTVAFTSSDVGTATPLGPVGEPASVLGQISAALVAAGVGALTQEGAAFWIESATQGASSRVAIGEGSANNTIRLTDNESSVREGVSAAALAASMMTESTASWKALFADVAGDGLDQDGAMVMIVTDASGDDYVQIQSPTLGLASSVAVGDCTAFRSGTGLLGTNGDQDNGESGRTGFHVTSDNPVGSGSSGSSVLNDGTGQDGVVGQTYRDEVTGLTFTLLAPLGGGNYSSNATSTFELTCADEITCDANVPIDSIPGVQLFVANTSSVGEGDTATITTHHKGGNEPAIGQSYYASYEYEKRNYSPRLFTKVASIEAAFGSVGATNQSSLASYLMFMNGATVVGVKQVRREEGKVNGSIASYLDAVTELEGLLPGRIRPSVLVPLLEYSHELGTFLSLHVDEQSNIRNQAERTCILGFSAGTQPSEAADLVAQLDMGEDENGMKVSGNPRIRCLYPDMLTVTTTDALGNEKEELVDGRYLAAMMAARQVSPNRDPATPWTGTSFVGTNGVARNLDTVTMNQVASAGVTVCENKPPFIRVRQGLTTDMGNVMTKTPSVVQIADEVQQQTRDTLEGFIGVKFLPQIISQVEGRLAEMYKQMVSAQIVSAYTGIKANISPNDPTACEVESFYQPIFPLLYIILKFNIRSSL